MTEFDATGEVKKFVEMLQVAGWDTGNNIKRNSDNMQFEVVSLGQKCNIKDSAGVVTAIRAEALLKKKLLQSRNRCHRGIGGLGSSGRAQNLRVEAGIADRQSHRGAG